MQSTLTWLQLYYVCIKNYPESELNHNIKANNSTRNRKKVLQIDTVLKLKKKHKNSKVKRKIEYDYLMDICKAN